MKELRDKLKNKLKGLDRKTINLNLLESIYIILRIIQERKKKRKRIIKEVEKLKIYQRIIY